MYFNRIVGALRHCRRIQDFGQGRSHHSQLMKSGLLNDVFIVNNLISMYVDFTLLNDARQLFDEMIDRNVVTWTTMISAYNTAGNPFESLGLYRRMLESGSEIPNSFTYSAALKACGLVGNLELGKLIHRRVCRDKLEADVVLMNTLLDMYVKCGSLVDVRKVFYKIVPKNLNSWNTIIAGYSNEGQMEEAVNLFHQILEPDEVSWNTIIAGFTLKESPKALEFVCTMHKRGVKLDRFTFPSALKACGCMSLLKMGKQVHCYAIKTCCECDCFTCSALVDMYTKCGGIDEAAELFDQYSSCKGSAHTRLAVWNSMLSAYASNGYNASAFNLISQMHSSGAHLDCYTFSSGLKACIDSHNLRLGIQVHGLIVTSGYELDYVVGSTLIDLYAKQGSIEKALGLFWRLPKKDIISWSGLISGCATKGLNWLVFSLFRNMIDLGIEVDDFVSSSVLKVCSSLAAVGDGKQVHAFCVKSGFDSEAVTMTSLIDMYTKCGNIEDGLTLFDCVTEKDTVCYTGIIVGCGQNGRPNEAIGFFQEMLKLGLQPNKITFLGVLSACGHAGLVGEAWSIFRSMAAEHGIKPCLEHYCCMIDLLGRAGCFEEAEKLIADMPYEPNQNILGSLLGACGIHRNIELGNRIAKNLSTFSEEPSVYVTLSNILSTSGMWVDSIRLRDTIKQVGTKIAGKSWIDVRI